MDRRTQITHITLHIVVFWDKTPSCYLVGQRFCQNDVNFLRRLALQEKKLDDSSRLDFVEIARVPDTLPSFVSFLVGLRTYQHPGTNIPEKETASIFTV